MSRDSELDQNLSGDFQKNLSSELNEIWYVGRGRWVMHNGMPYGRNQGQGHSREVDRQSPTGLIFYLTAYWKSFYENVMHKLVEMWCSIQLSVHHLNTLSVCMIWCVVRPDTTVVPSLQFRIDADSITVYNNELGFEEQNIRAVCDVGKTTKGKHKFGYIGLLISNWHMVLCILF